MVIFEEWSAIYYGKQSHILQVHKTPITLAFHFIITILELHVRKILILQIYFYTCQTNEGMNKGYDVGNGTKFSVCSMMSKGW